jgi:hypothetical protein
MENFAISLVCIALLIIGAVSISMTALNAVNSVSDALREEEGIARDIRDTSISCKSTLTINNGAGIIMDIDNMGKTNLLNYSGWDVIVRYQNGDTKRIPYSLATPGWTTSGFFFPGQSRDLRA